MKTLWCKNQKNPSDGISHAWAPLMRIQLLTLMRIPIWLFTLMRIRIRPFAFMRIRLWIRLLCCVSVTGLKTFQGSTMSLLGSFVSHRSSKSLHGSIVSSTSPSGLKRLWMRLFTLVRIRIRIQLPLNNADPCGSRITSLLVFSHIFEVSNRFRIQIAVHVWITTVKFHFVTMKHVIMPFKL